MARMSPAAISFRHSTALSIGAVMVMIAMVSLGAWAPYLLVLMVIPLAVAVWGWRSGTDADASGLTVTALFGRRRVPWSQVVGFTPTSRRRVAARLAGGTAIDLPAVTVEDLPRLVEVAGTELITDSR
jgi:hypothetical protein